MKQPLAIDLFCGEGGWTRGLLDAGFRVVGFDLVRFADYPGELIVQDVTTLLGRQLRDASLIVASPPCNEFSYRAMPWKRAKMLPPPYLGMALFQTCFRLQWQASQAAERYVPLIVENVVGAQKWVGKANCHHGSFYLWGDVPALMPPAFRARKQKGSGSAWFDSGICRLPSSSSRRREASAQIAMIPYPLARWIGDCFKQIL